ncbi:hypothetical protein M0F08_24655, partial [Ralstonia solanacearum]|nr:hypothetical protein [Ralstonia solanacearum]MCL9833157.1 hypothetical protein [Ralstonia solanacearum]MCL9837938.1 hypothetical protein [Ralstonia solanacearum]
MTVDLEFRGAWKPPSGASVDLDFGDTRQAVPEAANATIRIRLGTPKVHILATYDNLVSRKLEGGGQVPWQRAQRHEAGLQDGWDDSARDRVDSAVAWQPGEPVATTVGLAGGDNQRARSAGRVQWQNAAPVTSLSGDRFDPLEPQRGEFTVPWGEGSALSGGVASPFVWLVPRPRSQAQAWWLAVPLASRQGFGFSPGRGHMGRWSAPWETGRQPRPGESHLPVEPPPTQPEPRYHPDLNFLCPAT